MQWGNVFVWGGEGDLPFTGENGKEINGEIQGIALNKTPPKDKPCTLTATDLLIGKNILSFLFLCITQSSHYIISYKTTMQKMCGGKLGWGGRCMGSGVDIPDEFAVCTLSLQHNAGLLWDYMVHLPQSCSERGNFCVLQKLKWH